MVRNILITGAASGIGRATVERLKAAGDRVITVDLHDADITVDLGTADGRSKMLKEAERLAPEGLDGVVAGAGIGPADRGDRARATVGINYFGAVATLEGLRPLLARSMRPRAVAICSTAAMLQGNPQVVQACLDGSEAGALDQAAASPDTAYLDSKRALSLWVRRSAGDPQWAGAGIMLNGVAPGVVRTAMTKPFWGRPEMVELIRTANPIAVPSYGEPEDIAELVAFMLGFDTQYLLGQIIFIDGGTDVLTRPEHV